MLFFLKFMPSMGKHINTRGSAGAGGKKKAVIYYYILRIKILNLRICINNSKIITRGRDVR